MKNYSFPVPLSTKFVHTRLCFLLYGKVRPEQYLCLNIFAGRSILLMLKWVCCWEQSGRNRSWSCTKYLGEGKNWFISDKKVLSIDQIFLVPQSARNAWLGKCLSNKTWFCILRCLSASFC